jgi:hypothetical protein
MEIKPMSDIRTSLCRELERLSYGMDPMELLKIEEEEQK